MAPGLADQGEPTRTGWQPGWPTRAGRRGRAGLAERGSCGTRRPARQGMEGGHAARPLAPEPEYGATRTFELEARTARMLTPRERFVHATRDATLFIRRGGQANLSRVDQTRGPDGGEMLAVPEVFAVSRALREGVSRALREGEAKSLGSRNRRADRYGVRVLSRDGTARERRPKGSPGGEREREESQGERGQRAETESHERRAKHLRGWGRQRSPRQT